MNRIINLKNNSCGPLFVQFYIILLLFSANMSMAQIVNLPCQTEDVAVEDLERKDFENPSGSTAIHSQGSMHNFTLPSADDYPPCKIISNITVVISAFGVDLSNLPPDCIPTPLPYYYNIALGCVDFIPASCDLSNYLGEPNTPTFTNQNLSYNGDFDFGENLAVDIVPVMNINCTAGQTSLTSDAVVLDYEICVTVTISDAPSTIAVDLGPDINVCPNETTTLDAGFIVDTDYLWDPNGETTQMITAGQGTYSVTVTDVNGCTDSDEISVLLYPLSSISFNPATPSVCDNGQVSVSVNENYSTYNWSNSATGQTVSLSPGIYSVTITDSNNCTSSESITVENVPPPNAGSDNFLQVCNDGSLYNLDALLMVHDAGGTWADVDFSGVNVNSNPMAVDFSIVSAGTYDFTYTVMGNNPCPPDEAIITIEVFNEINPGTSAFGEYCADPGIVDFYLLINNPDLGGSWFDADGSGIDLFDPFNVNLDGLSTGTYVYEYQLDNNGPCPGETTFLTITILDGVFAGFDNQATVCEGTQFNLEDLVSGANTTGTFIDSDGSGALTGSIVNTNGLAGQSFNFTFLVGSFVDPCGTDEAILTLNIETALFAGDDATNSGCKGDQINFFDILSNEDIGGSFVDVAMSGGISGNILNTENIVAGTYVYEYIVGDGISCPMDTAEIEITIFDLPDSEFSFDTLIICESFCEEIEINLSGIQPFSFPIEVYSSTTGELVLSDNIITNNFNYLITACNIGDTLSFSNDTLSLESDSTWIVVIPSISDTNCSRDDIFLTDTLIIRTKNNSFYQFDTTACITDTVMINGFSFYNGNGIYNDTIPGQYCDSIINILVTFQDIDTVLISPTICFGDSIFIENVWYNESMPYEEITISNPNGCDSLIIIDLGFYPLADSTLNLLLCSGDSVIVNNTVYNLANPIGTEILKDQAANGCDSVVQISIQFSNDIIESIKDTLCPDGFIFLDNMTFDINNPTGQVVKSGTGCDTIVNIDLSFYNPADSMINGLYCTDFGITVNGILYDITNPSGTEVLLNSSSFGCDSIVVIDLAFFPEEIVDFSETICDNDSIIINGTIYNIDNPTGTEVLLNASENGCDSTIMISLTIIDTYFLNEEITICQGDSIFLSGSWQFNGGTYVDSLKSIDLCDSIISTIVTIDPCQFDITFVKTDNNCVNGNDGTITLNFPSNIPLPYIIKWTSLDNGNSDEITLTSFQSQFDIVMLFSGVYSVEVTDNVGKILYTDFIEIFDLNPPLEGIWEIKDSILCFDDLATIEFLAIGGLSPYSYKWNPMTIGNSSTAEDINAGNYSITVTDINNCNYESSISILAPDEINADIIIQDVTCEGKGDGQILVQNITGGVSPYSVYVNNELLGSNSITNLIEGSYTIDIVDSNDCQLSLSETIFSSGNEFNINYNEFYTITSGETVALSAIIDQGNYTYDWITNTNTLSCTDCSSPIASPTSDTNYEVIVTNEMGCSKSFNIIVSVLEIEIIDVLPNIFSPNGDNNNDKFIYTSIEEVATIRLLIFDRWGNSVFNNQTNENSIEWDGRFNGKVLNPGVYVYKLDIESLDGDVKSIFGDLLLVK